MGKCEYLNCKNLTRRIKRDKVSNLSFFRFPNDVELCKKWIEACQSESLFDVGVAHLHKSHVICGVHFKDFDFVNPLTKKKLRAGAMPSQHSVSTVPKSNVISSFGHYVVRNRHEKLSESHPDFDKDLTVTKEKSKCKKKLRNLETSKDLDCLKKLTNMSQNIGSLIHPISPPAVPSSLDCSDPNECSRHFSAIHQSGNSISAHSVPTSQSPHESFAMQNLVTTYIKIIETQPNLEKSKSELLPPCFSGTLSYKLNSIKSSGKEKCLKLNDCLENPRTFLPVDVTTVMLDNQNLKEFRNKDLYGKVVNISLANNDISELHWFVNIPNLRNLNLKKNKLSSIKDLNLLGHAANIDLSNNLIQSLVEFVPIPAKTYENIQSLNLSGNKIAEIVNLTALPNLNDLNLSNNYIKSLKNFERYLPNSISKISLEDNYISDWNDFNALTALQNLKNISVHNNPCFHIYVSALGDNKSNSLLQNIDFIPFLIVRFPRVAMINGKVITTEERNVARMLITKESILSSEFNDKNLLLSCLANYCMKSDNELSKIENLTKSEEFLHVQTLTKNSDITYERDTHECFSASSSRNNNAMEKKCRQNYIELIEERARSYKLTREVETLTDKIQFLETFLFQNGLSMDDFVIKSEEDEPEIS